MSQELSDGWWMRLVWKLTVTGVGFGLAAYCLVTWCYVCCVGMIMFGAVDRGGYAVTERGGALLAIVAATAWMLGTAVASRAAWNQIAVPANIFQAGGVDQHRPATTEILKRMAPGTAWILFLPAASLVLDWLIPGLALYLFSVPA